MPKFDKNATYKTRELADLIMLNYPGRFKTINSCMTNIAKSIKRLGLEPSNKQKRCRVFAGKDAQAIHDDMVSIARGTPIEKAVKIAERELENMTGLVIGPDGGVRPIYDAFASHRKQFYTDFKYFIKFAQSPEERLAIIEALTALYGAHIKKEG